MNVYEIQFRQIGFSTLLESYQLVESSLEDALAVAKIQVKKEYRDMAESNSIEAVSARELVRSVMMPAKGRTGK